MLATRLRMSTGGSLLLYDHGSKEDLWQEGYKCHIHTTEKRDDHLYLHIHTAGTHQITYVTVDVIDIKPYSKIYIDWSNTGYNRDEVWSALVASTDQMGTVADQDARLRRYKAFSRTIDGLDVRSLTGSHYIRVHTGISGPHTITSEVSAFRVWLV